MTQHSNVALEQGAAEMLLALPGQLQTLTARIDEIHLELEDKIHKHGRRLNDALDKIRIVTAAEHAQDEVWKALAKTQSEIKDAAKDSEADAGKYKYKYAALSNVLAEIRPVASRNGLAITQLPGRTVSGDVEYLTLTTIIGHESGQTIENYFEMYSPRDPQGIGSTMTYMRRYVLMAMFGIAGADDDDAEKGQPKTKTISAEQADIIFNTADELFGADAEGMLERMCKKIHMVDEVRLIPAAEFEVAIKRLENQAQKRGTKPPEEVEGKSEKPAAKKPASKPTA